MVARLDSNTASSVIEDQECSFCHRTGTHIPTYCPPIDQAIASR